MSLYDRTIPHLQHSDVDEDCEVPLDDETHKNKGI